MTRHKLCTHLLVISFCLLAFAANATTFTFTAIPDEDESRLVARFGAVADYLSEELGVEVNYIPVKSYAAAVTAFRNGQVQLAWFGGLSGVQARLQVPGSVALAQGYEDQFFKTYLIANTRTGLTRSKKFPAAIKGKTFTFGSKGSTSGRLMPEYYIREFFEQPPQRVFSRVGFSGDHSMTIAQVQAGAFDVGAVNYLVWESELAAGKVDLQKVRVIWETPDYPDYQWTLRGDADKQFGAGFANKVKRALVEMNDPELLASFPRKSFVPADNSDYTAIEETARAIQLIR
ncbi:phosphate/phosphite/phosphonate ABC transporter, periplasmic binding protein [Teredinibacter turnerae T7901]|uniref:Phosphate/phosphite/phosphonate ABC transporter, periplasmic binding protein n=1 Tax=Teredinibacter turnerae (strain ATCC 39867 / T7901) TaxID=377629 RepID=C5BNF1_TERTT|nr:putative selenate ABC transporter substrate-binding protein [Teredinibacter turnerae]ACR13815.1 phosphate/phosphite/phosphonate ABC transporter, periplasmic binding protein [Teredinibacter turnerae T7901]